MSAEPQSTAGRPVFPTYPLTRERCQWCPPEHPPCPVGDTDAVLLDTPYTSPRITRACLTHAVVAVRTANDVGVPIFYYNGTFPDAVAIVGQLLNEDTASSSATSWEPPAARAS